MTGRTTLTDRFDQALTYAREHHRDDWRKGTDIPYVSHLLGVCSLVLDMEGSEDEATHGWLQAGRAAGGEERCAGEQTPENHTSHTSHRASRELQTCS